MGSILPTNNAENVSRDINISAAFSCQMQAASSSSFVVNGGFTGKFGGTYTGAGTNTLTFAPKLSLKPGELVEVTLPPLLSSADNMTLSKPFVSRFRAAVALSTTGQVELSSTTRVGNEPGTVTSGDLDGDGDVDLAVVIPGSGTVSILLNNGSGSYTVASSPAVGSIPVWVTSGDLDGDGDLDLAVSNRTSGTVSILLNDGSGNFTLQWLGTGMYAATLVTAGDFNGDGKLDLAMATNANDHFWVQIFHNDGSGSFFQSTDWSVVNGTAPQSVTSGDFDGDGDLDLALSTVGYSGGLDNVSILKQLPCGALHLGWLLLKC